MATTRKTITITTQQDDWIKAQIEAGLYTNDSEYVRDLIRRDQAQQVVDRVRAQLLDNDDPENTRHGPIEEALAAELSQRMLATRDL